MPDRLYLHVTMVPATVSETLSSPAKLFPDAVRVALIIVASPDSFTVQETVAVHPFTTGAHAPAPALASPVDITFRGTEDGQLDGPLDSVAVPLSDD